MTALDDASVFAAPGRTAEVVLAEKAVLASMIASRPVAEEALDLLGPDDCMGEPEHQVVYAAVRWLTEEMPVPERGSLAAGPDVDAGVQRRFAAVLGRLIKVERGIWRTGQAGTILSGLVGYATPAWRGAAAEVLRAAAQRRTVAAAESLRTTAARPGFDASEHGEMLRKLLDDALGAPVAGTGAATAADLFMETLQRLESGRPPGVIQFPWAALRELVPYLRPGQLVSVLARPSHGKALALDTPLPTPAGWTTMGDVGVGDYLIGADGKPVRVIAATTVMRGRPCYRITFSDGAEITADAQHEWLTETRASRKSANDAQAARSRTRARHVFPAVRTTEEIARTVRCPTADRRLNHAVANAAPLSLPVNENLIIPPYVLGAWLGDGDANGAGFTTADPEMVLKLEAEGIEVRPLAGRLRYSMRIPREAAEDRTCIGCGATFTPKSAHVLTCGRKCGGSRAARAARRAPARPTCRDCGALTGGASMCAACRATHGSMRARLRTLGVLNNKHVPVAYVRASEPQRRALLAGLLDTDGTVSVRGDIQYTSTSPGLVAGVRELVVSLGYRCGISTRKVPGRSAASSTAYTLTFAAADDVFRLERKAAVLKERRRPGAGSRSRTRTIVSVEPVASVPVRCVQVDAPDHLYLAGQSMIPTHNSLIAADLARFNAIKHRIPTVLFTMEMDRDEMMDRLLSAETGVLLDRITEGNLDDLAWDKLAAARERFAESKLVIDDTPRATLAHIRARLRGMARTEPAQLAIIDYLQLMAPPKGGENRQQEVSALVGGLKAVAREFRIPVVMLCQLNRGPEHRQDRRPHLSDARESGSVDNDSDVAILIHREDFYDPESPRAGEADLIVDKNRNGRRGTAVVGFQGHYARFAELPWSASRHAGNTP